MGAIAVQSLTNTTDLPIREEVQPHIQTGLLKHIARPLTESLVEELNEIVSQFSEYNNSISEWFGRVADARLATRALAAINDPDADQAVLVPFRSKHNVPGSKVAEKAGEIIEACGLHLNGVQGGTSNLIGILEAFVTQGQRLQDRLTHEHRDTVDALDILRELCQEKVNELQKIEVACKDPETTPQDPSMDLQDYMDGFRETFDTFYECLKENAEPLNVLHQQLREEDLKTYEATWGRFPSEQGAHLPYDYQMKAAISIYEERALSRQALAVLATGLGKTTIAALVAQLEVQNHGGRVLVLLHQRELLENAKATIEKFLPPTTTYGYMTGVEKESGKPDCLFATLQTMTDIVNQFDPKEFSLVIFDEAHHAAAPTYRKVVEHFKPNLRTGFTATPERTDWKDIRQIFGDEVVQCPLMDGLAAGLLAPVEYEMIVQESVEELRKLNIVDEETRSGVRLNLTVSPENIASLIKAKIRHVRNPRVLIYCSTTEDADSLLPHLEGSVAVHTKMAKGKRDENTKSFGEGRARYLAAVDIFNEGRDIPSANVLVFLRSMTSPNTFYQQLGRGLRRYPGKYRVLALDLAGNVDHIGAVYRLWERVRDKERPVARRRPTEPLEGNDHLEQPTYFRLRGVKKMSDFLGVMKTWEESTWRFAAPTLLKLGRIIFSSIGTRAFKHRDAYVDWKASLTPAEEAAIKEDCEISRLPSIGPFFYRFNAAGGVTRAILRSAINKGRSDDEQAIYLEEIQGKLRLFNGVPMIPDTVGDLKRVEAKTFAEIRKIASPYTPKGSNVGGRIELAREILNDQFTDVADMYITALVKMYPRVSVDHEDAKIHALMYCWEKLFVLNENGKRDSMVAIAETLWDSMVGYWYEQTNRGGAGPDEKDPFRNRVVRRYYAGTEEWDLTEIHASKLVRDRFYSPADAVSYDESAANPTLFGSAGLSGEPIRSGVFDQLPFTPEDVMKALDILSPRERGAVLGINVEGLTLEQLTPELKMSREGVRHAGHRALVRLQSELFRDK